MENFTGKNDAVWTGWFAPEELVRCVEKGLQDSVGALTVQGGDQVAG